MPQHSQLRWTTAVFHKPRHYLPRVKNKDGEIGSGGVDGPTKRSWFQVGVSWTPKPSPPLPGAGRETMRWRGAKSVPSLAAADKPMSVPSLNFLCG